MLKEQIDTWKRLHTKLKIMFSAPLGILQDHLPFYISTHHASPSKQYQYVSHMWDLKRKE